MGETADTGGRLVCELIMPPTAHLYAQIIRNARSATRVARHAACAGRRLLLCGAGPSLRGVAPYRAAADDVWGCNSALPWLAAHGIAPTHGFCVDQGEAMLGPEEWGGAPAADYYLATCVHPRLVAHLRRAGRRLTFFHSYLGQPDPPGWRVPRSGASYEWHLYTTLFRSTVQVGFGLNSVQRAAALAMFLGYAQVTIIGADCAALPDAAPMPLRSAPSYDAWRRSLCFYADGRAAGAYGTDELILEGEIDGRRWHTRGDMVMSAVHMLQLLRMFPDRVTLVGDTLTHAILPHAEDAEWMARLPQLTGAGCIENLSLRAGEAA